MEEEKKYASCTKRFLAMLIDGVLLGVPLYAAMYIMPDRAQALNAGFQAICAVYYIILDSSDWRGTLGKRMLKLRVGTREDARLTMGQSALRYFLYILPMLPLLGLEYTSGFAALQASNGDPAIFKEPEMQGFMVAFGISVALLLVALLLLYWLPMLFTKQKTALHDGLSKTRVFQA